VGPPRRCSALSSRSRDWRDEPAGARLRGHCHGPARRAPRATRAPPGRAPRPRGFGAHEEAGPRPLCSRRGEVGPSPCATSWLAGAQTGARLATGRGARGPAPTRCRARLIAVAAGCSCSDDSTRPHSARTNLDGAAYHRVSSWAVGPKTGAGPRWHCGLLSTGTRAGGASVEPPTRAAERARVATRAGRQVGPEARAPGSIVPAARRVHTASQEQLAAAERGWKVLLASGAWWSTPAAEDCSGSAFGAAGARPVLFALVGGASPEPLPFVSLLGPATSMRHALIARALGRPPAHNESHRKARPCARDRPLARGSPRRWRCHRGPGAGAGFALNAGAGMKHAVVVLVPPIDGDQAVAPGAARRSAAAWLNSGPRARPRRPARRTVQRALVGWRPPERGALHRARTRNRALGCHRRGRIPRTDLCTPRRAAPG